MKEENQVESNSRIFEYLGVISFLATAFVCACSYLIFKILFTEEYLSGYISAPYLFLAPLLQMLFQVAANQFIVVKKTWPNMFILGVGAIVNIIINYTLIPAIGIEGASLATLVGYVISDIICVIVLCKMELMVVSKRFMGVCAIMVGYLLLWRLFFTERVIVGTIFAIAMTFIYAVQYRKEAQTLVKALLGR
jgi:O-antigen/teichoic acid export membrane protein